MHFPIAFLLLTFTQICNIVILTILYDRIAELCEANSINITAMCKESGASRASLTDLKKGRKQSLSADTLSKISSYFGVTVDYLLTGEGAKKAPTQESEREIAFDDFTYAMQNEAKDLTDMDKQILLSMAKQLNDARKKKDGESG